MTRWLANMGRSQWQPLGRRPARLQGCGAETCRSPHSCWVARSGSGWSVWQQERTLWMLARPRVFN
jgi:hypothetical protein